MDRKNISSGSPFEKKIGFSGAVLAEGRIYISGTAPVSPDGNTLYPKDLYHQTLSCLEIMKAAVEKAGGKWKNVVRTRIYLKNAQDWEQAAKAHNEMLSDIGPACTFIGVEGFIDPEWLVETEAECIYSSG